MVAPAPLPTDPPCGDEPETDPTAACESDDSTDESTWAAVIEHAPTYANVGAGTR